MAPFLSGTRLLGMQTVPFQARHTEVTRTWVLWDANGHQGLAGNDTAAVLRGEGKASIMGFVRMPAGLAQSQVSTAGAAVPHTGGNTLSH